MDFFSAYFPEIERMTIPSPEIRYPVSGKMVWKMAAQAPRILSGIRQEHDLLKDIIKEYKIDAVISDNRFGLWSKEVYSVYITHQLRIKAPDGWKFAENIISGIHRKFINNYNECWIPDYSGDECLSGELGHPASLPANCYYIGPLSRFNSKIDNAESIIDDESAPGVLFLLSGPEPQRTIFENIILDELSINSGCRAIILRGLPGNGDNIPSLPHVTMHSHLPDDEMSSLIKSAKMIICRPGYSTLMDLAILGRSAILVPTPGQTEQEYLAKYHSSSKSYVSFKQSEFKLEKAIEAGSRLVPPGNLESSEKHIEGRVKNLIEKL
jgi:hypothetical protein